MTTTQHTPGPWRTWRDMDPKEPLSIVGPSEDFTCSVAMENTQAQANARLIAAAPELLEALKFVVAALTQPVQTNETDSPATCAILRGDAAIAVKHAQAAITKALL